MTRRAPGTHHDAGWILPTALGLSVMLLPMIVGLRYAGADAPEADAGAATVNDGDSEPAEAEPVTDRERAPDPDLK